MDEPLVVDGNLITSRMPADLPAFNDAIAQAVGLGRVGAGSTSSHGGRLDL